MALTPGKMEVDVAFDPERIARDLANSLAGALADITGALLNYANPDSTNPDSTPPDAAIIDWPLKTRAPKMIVTCPTCFQSVEGEPLSWEIVLDPTNGRLTNVRGLFMHAHEDTQIEVRWPFVATWEEPKREPRFTHDPVVGSPFEAAADDLEEGQERSSAWEGSEPWEFTPETDGSLPLRSAVFQALGGASTCWDEDASLTGFDSERCVEIGEALLKVIDALMIEAGWVES